MYMRKTELRESMKAWVIISFVSFYDISDWFPYVMSLFDFSTICLFDLFMEYDIPLAFDDKGQFL